MNKTLFQLRIGDYAPEITSLTDPLVERWAEARGYTIHRITERKFPEWDTDYEKLQIYDLIPQLGVDFAWYLDSDAVVHPELPDLSTLIPRDTVAHNGADFGPIRWRDDEFFRRDGRHLGSCNWCTMGWADCRDLWRPLDDLTFAQAVANIRLTVEEGRGTVKSLGQNGAPTTYWPPVVTREHLVSDYALSRNLARFGLKFTTLGALWKRHGLEQANFFFHVYTVPAEEKAKQIRDVLAKWRID